MKSLLAFGALGAALYQLITFLLTRRAFNELPSVKGIVTESKLDDYSDAEGKRVYSANIEFKFTLNNEEYTSNSSALRSFQLVPDHNYECNLVGKYESGDVVTVRYKAGCPDQAYLEVAPLSLMSAAAVLLGSSLAVTYLVYIKFLIA